MTVTVTTVSDAVDHFSSLVVQIANRPYKYVHSLPSHFLSPRYWFICPIHLQLHYLKLTYRLHKRTYSDTIMHSTIPSQRRRISSSDSPNEPLVSARNKSADLAIIYRKMLEQVHAVTFAAAETVAQAEGQDGVARWQTLRGLMEGFEDAERRGMARYMEGNMMQEKSKAKKNKRDDDKSITVEDAAKAEGRKMLQDIEVSITSLRDTLKG